MMYAKDEKTQHTLRDNWHDIVCDRRYVSIVMGNMEKEGTVQSWLTDRKLYVSSSPVDDGGKFSVTHYRTIKRANGFSLIELQLETGRKNQIRNITQSLGHPVGDNHGSGSRPVGTFGSSCLQALLLSSRYRRTDGVRNSLSYSIQNLNAEKIRTSIAYIEE